MTQGTLKKKKTCTAASRRAKYFTNRASSLTAEPYLLKQLRGELFRKRLRKVGHALLGVVRLPVTGEESVRDVASPLVRIDEQRQQHKVRRKYGTSIVQGYNPRRGRRQSRRQQPPRPPPRHQQENHTPQTTATRWQLCVALAEHGGSFTLL